MPSAKTADPTGSDKALELNVLLSNIDGHYVDKKDVTQPGTTLVCTSSSRTNIKVMTKKLKNKD